MLPPLATSVTAVAVATIADSGGGELCSAGATEAAAAAAAVRFLLLRVLLALAVESPTPDSDLTGGVLEDGRNVGLGWGIRHKITCQKQAVKRVRGKQNRFEGNRRVMMDSVWGVVGIVPG